MANTKDKKSALNLNSVNADLSLDAYTRWHKKATKEAFDIKTKNWLTDTLTKAADFENMHGLVHQINQNIGEWSSKYEVEKGYNLLNSSKLILQAKPYESVINKLYRKNYDAFKNNQTDCALTIQNCFDALNDTIRGIIVVKYLDGVDYVASEIKRLGAQNNIEVKISKEAKTEGYFAQHLTYSTDINISLQDWSTEKKRFNVEIQVATQLQEVIRKLTHKQYEVRRTTFENKTEPWQWNYKNDEFFLNSMGHMIHYLEGMILEVRDKKTSSK